MLQLRGTMVGKMVSWITFQKRHTACTNNLKSPSYFIGSPEFFQLIFSKHVEYLGILDFLSNAIVQVAHPEYKVRLGHAYHTKTTESH